MKTSIQWWSEIKQDPERLKSWLKNQAFCENGAAEKIQQYSSRYKLNTEQQSMIHKIITDEKRHGAWVRQLLTNRGVEQDILEKEERYWNETLPAIENFNTFEYFCLVSYLAEDMRLERIRAIVNDDDAPEDIRDVFKKILPDELTHTMMFGHMSSGCTTQEKEAALAYHSKGRNSIGLES